jgi:hypothetical protein
MSGVAKQAVFTNGGMLVGKRPAILRVAAQTELVGVRHAQIVAGSAAMRIVAIPAAHLPFPQRVVVRQAHLAALGLVTAEARIIRLPPRLHHHLGFGHQILNRGYTARGRHVYESLGFGFGLGAVGMGLMAFRAADLIRGVGPRSPVAKPRILRVTAQAHAIGIGSRPVRERNDFRYISAAFDVQAAGAVAFFAVNTLLRVEGVPEIVGDFSVARSAGVAAGRLSPGNLDILCERADAIG